jgi:hypothetical protein
LRDRADVVLEGIAVEAGHEFPAMAFAASYIRKLAREIWESGPLQPPRPAAMPFEHSEVR